MGAKARQKPKRLAEKLTRIRLGLGLSQNELIKLFGAGETLTQNKISSYELGTGEPSLITLLLYARAANVCADVLIDDDLELPAKLPAKAKYRP